MKEGRMEGLKTSWWNWVEGKSTQQRGMEEAAENSKELSHSAHDIEWMNHERMAIFSLSVLQTISCGGTQHSTHCYLNFKFHSLHLKAFKIQLADTCYTKHVTSQNVTGLCQQSTCTQHWTFQGAVQTSHTDARAIQWTITLWMPCLLNTVYMYVHFILNITYLNI